MYIGVLAESFGEPLRDSILRAAALGASGIQMYAVDGPTAPENMGPAARRELKRFVHDQGMVFSALCGDMGGGGFAFAEQNEGRIERTCRIVDMALDLDCRIITTHIGVVPSNASFSVMDMRHPRVAVMADALDRLGTYAQKAGAVFAIETGPESAAVLKHMLDLVGNPGIGVNLDPANLVMSTNDDPVQAVHLLGNHIVHTHAKDGIFLKQGDLDVAYGMTTPQEAYNEADYCIEVPLGKGQVDFPRYLAALKEIGYAGFLTIERETGNDPAADIRDAIDFLRMQLGRLT